MRKFNRILLLVLMCTLIPKMVYAADLGSPAGVAVSVGAETVTKGSVPGTVVDLSVSNTGTNEVDLSWSAVNEAKSYRIYRSLNNLGPFRYVGTTKATDFKNKGLKASTTYYYCISAGNTAGDGLKSSAVAAVTKGVVPSLVTGLKLSNPGTIEANLTWKAVKGASSYIIYRGVNLRDFTQVGTSETAGFSDKSLQVNTKYYYKVSAVNANGEGRLSNAVSFTINTKTLIYTALGDSIALGTNSSPGKDYVDLYYNYLKNQPGNRKMALYNEAASGNTSSDLLNKLQDSDVQKLLLNSKVVTISIGSNNLLKPTIYALAAAFNLNPTAADFTTELSAKLADPQNLPVIAALQSPDKLPKALTDGVNQFAADWGSIIADLKKLSPNAEINVVTLYNPLRPDDALFGLFDPSVQAINTIIKASAKDNYKVADVYPVFLSNSGTPLTGMNLLNPHPTDAGYNVIYQTLVSLGL